MYNVILNVSRSKCDHFLDQHLLYTEINTQQYDQAKQLAIMCPKITVPYGTAWPNVHHIVGRWSSLPHCTPHDPPPIPRP